MIINRENSLNEGDVVLVQSYEMPLQGVPPANEVNIVGCFVYSSSNDNNEVWGFISKRLPDDCAEVTLFAPQAIAYFDGMCSIKEKLTEKELVERMQLVIDVSPMFRQFIVKLLQKKL